MRTVVIGSKTYKVGDDNKILGEYVGPLSVIEEVNVVATEDIAAFLPVIASGKVADSNNSLHRTKVVGISRNSVLTGFVANVQFSGEIQNSLWNWTVGDVIFIRGKLLSNIVPTISESLWCQQIGVATRSNTIVIELKTTTRF